LSVILSLTFVEFGPTVSLREKWSNRKAL